MSRRARIAFLVLVAAQAAFPLGIVAWNEVALARGTDVTLATAPVDPYDPFRGRYVTLRYEISTLPVSGQMDAGDTVYVPLYEQGDVWTGTRATTTRPEEGTFIRGRVTYAAEAGGTADIRYGIETYYADEDEARRLEGVSGSLAVEVDLDDDGKARIEDVDVRGG
jgi:uncharacterized membrane-anchored protein